MGTYGPSGQPAATTFNYDALVATSLGKYRPTMVDNISAANAFWKYIPWESESGGLFVAQDLMYGLATADSYDGYDVLDTTPTNGITQAKFDWSQSATPFSISGKEKKMNKHRIVNLISAKLQQCEIGTKEFFAKALFQGSYVNGVGSSLTTPYTSPSNGSTFIDPLPKLIYYESGSTWPSLTVGGIDQNTQSWWRNQSVASTATTYAGLLDEMMNLYNLCSKGAGGAPDLCLTDQITWQLIQRAMRDAKWDSNANSDLKKGRFPFPALNFWGCDVIWDEFMPNVAGGNLTTGSTGKGTLYFINTKFWRCVYEAETNFVPTEMERPINQDAFFKHILWMGTVTLSNRKKQGVLGNIARTLT